MPFVNGVITITAAAQQCHTALGVADAQIRMIILQPGGANANPCFLGGSGVTTANGIRLPAGAAGVPPAPLQLSELFQGQLALSDLWVVGTADETLRVFWLT